MSQIQESALATTRDARDVASSNIYPIEFSKWSKGARRLWKFVTGLPSWKAGWASPSDERLREQFEFSDRRPIQRARRELVELGELEHREVRRGDFLPNGTRAKYRHWIYLEGRAMLARRAGEGTEMLPAPQAQVGTETTPKTHRDGAISVHRLILKERSDPNSLSRTQTEGAPPTEREPVAPADQLSLRSSQKRPPADSSDIATSILACHIAKHFVAATGLAWRRIDPAVIDFIVPIIDGMHGDGPSRITRACRVIDAVVREATEASARMPTLRYVFHQEIFWKRLADLDNPASQSLRRSPAPKNPSPPVERPALPKKIQPIEPTAVGTKQAPSPASHPRPDFLGPNVPDWLREAIGKPTPAAASAAFSEDELAELRALENAARSRSGLPSPRAA